MRPKRLLVVGKFLILALVVFGLAMLPACGGPEEKPKPSKKVKKAKPAKPKPAATQPAATQPAKPKPAATQPAATQPAKPKPATPPAATQPAATQPAATQPAATQPAGSNPDSNGPAVAKGDLVPIPLVLPKPRFSGTPKQVPPGTRIKPTTGPAKPRPDFYAPKGVQNVALKKPVIASDMEPVIGTLDLVTDGSKEAVEDAYVELGPAVQWVQIDLGAKYKVYAIVVWHEHKDARVYKDVVIQLADDKDFITNVQEVFNNDHDNTAGQGLGEEWEYFETNAGKLVDCKGKVGRYLRLYSNGSTADDLNRYTEVEVYGLPAQ
jgi:hypothetical protein